VSKLSTGVDTPSPQRAHADATRPPLSGGEGDSSALESFGYRQELKRSLSLFDLLVYGLVFIVPTAPFAVFGIVFNASKGMVPLIYLVGLCAMLFTAYSYRLMSAAYPVAGSVYAYAARSIGPEAGFMAGWAILLDYLLLPALAYVAAAIALESLLPGVPRWVWIVGMLSVATAINYLGIEATTRVNFVLLGVQMVVLAILAAYCVIGVMHHTGGAHVSLAPLYNPAVLTPSLIFGALSLAVLSFLGFDAISTLSEEVKGGPHLVGRATVLSLIVCALLFIAQTWLFSLFALDRMSFPPGQATDGALYNIAIMLGGKGLRFLVAVPGVVLSVIAGAIVAQAATARILFGMARDGKLPRALAHVEPKRKVPERAVFLVALITLVLGIALADQFELLTSMVSFGALVGFFMVHVSVVAHFVVRGKSRDWLRHLLMPAIGAAIVVYVLVNAETNAKIAGAAWLAVGACVLVWFRMSGRSAPAQGHR
jgi:amino acid transporter